MNRKKLLSLLLALAMTAAVLTGCGSRNTNGGAAGEMTVGLHMVRQLGDGDGGLRRGVGRQGVPDVQNRLDGRILPSGAVLFLLLAHVHPSSRFSSVYRYDMAETSYFASLSRPWG